MQLFSTGYIVIVVRVRHFLVLNLVSNTAKVFWI